MLCGKNLAFLTLFCSSTILALPQSSTAILRRDDQACQVCTDCTPFEDKDTCVNKLAWGGGDGGIVNYGDDSHVAVEFETSGFSAGDVYTNTMTIISNEMQGNGYNLEVIFNKFEKDNNFKVVNTTKVPFYYTIKGPKSCKMGTPGGFTLSDVDSVKSMAL